MTASAAIFAMLNESLGPLLSGRDNPLGTSLLLLILAFALAVGLACSLVVVRLWRVNRLAQQRRLARLAHFPRPRRAQAPGPALPSRWLALWDAPPRAVIAALHLRGPAPCSWQQALAADREQRLFVSPQLEGWTLVFGAGLPDPVQDVDALFHFLADLSRKLGHVQYFSVEGRSRHHCWAMLDRGRVRRAYAWAGRTVWNQGDPTPAERELGLRCLDYCEALPEARPGRADPLAQNAERVPWLAARWSFDPGALDARAFRDSYGITGRLSRPKTV
jgi:hypothetical protein